MKPKNKPQDKPQARNQPNPDKRSLDNPSPLESLGSPRKSTNTIKSKKKNK